YELKKGDRIAVLSAFRIELIALFGAAQKAGFVIVPINTRLTATEVDFQLKNSGAKLVIAESNFKEQTEQTHLNVIKWGDTLGGDSDPYAVELKEEDPLFILYTSGTTGLPKGAVYTHKMLFWNSVNTHLRLNLTANDTTVNCMPAFHTGGWNVLITPLLHHGGTIWLTNEFEAEDVLANLEKSESTLFMAVPTMLKILGDTERFSSLKLPSIRYFIVGGEALPIPVIEAWDEKGIPIRQGYGLTEVGPNVTSLHQNDALQKRGSIGFFNFYIDARVVSDSGTDCKTNEVGELWLKGPNVSPGYWQNNDANASSFVDGWFKTGDLVRIDAEGFVFVAGRKKEMYISGGENVYPREVEKVIQSHPDVTEASVIGVPDKKWGESGAAWVATRDNTPLNQSALKAYVAERLAKFKIPKYFFFTEALPLNTTGKIDKKKLLELYTNQQKTSNHENV
ncbi:MAG TPA: AMP-binding protein, partial [Cryomorphaceae bacterium]|nr:AMP-binding protein [Cryomorphaceae bacterium]